MNSSLHASSEALRGAIEEASQGLIDRESLVELIVLCAVAGEHLLVIGPPGTAKSEAVRRVSRAIDARYFEYLLGRFTEPSEIFGPINLQRLKEGVVETETTGMLPEAEIAFLDEIFLGSTAILNTLLTLLNERIFRRGHTALQSPLKICVGASNSIPSGEALAAFGDRFLVQLFVEPIPDNRLEELLIQGWSMQNTAQKPRATIRDLEILSLAARQADPSAIRKDLVQAIRTLREAGIALSDRRVVKIQRLIAASAVMAGRSNPTVADLWPIVFAVPGANDQEQARDLLRPLLDQSANKALSSAAASASASPASRAALILKKARTAMIPPQPHEDRNLWKLRLEAIAREVDAGFTDANRPSDLTALRAQILKALATE